ncbi:methyltransferase domain-containing protein [Apilactobacillus apisilvae]|uniref:Methyltransferase domain-containing protein n=1 Tax=Apilactobacillus apisilvae TaxID=2923364 RepID=A0ABY4PJ89_9LACO|nr:class I SAM-dependent methyltransferase [Apilactobacillus apisilvae]UQS85703.1 methyltransferase domain-containing protein [Apilactobacillus apisilvae]
MKLQPSLRYSHQLLKNIVQPGNIVVDATVGKGNDTAFLARLVKNKGKVYGFDLQKEAIQITQNRLDENDLKNVQLFNTGHENIKKYVKENISAAIFNLGYLPGGNKNIITKPNTTLKAIKDCLYLLEQNGIVVLVLYYGHQGGKEEKNSVLSFVKNLNQKQYSVLEYKFINQINEPPILIAIQKK